MHGLTKLALGVAMLGGSGAAAHASMAGGIAGPPGYDSHRPCEVYLNHDLPAPRRCYRFFSNALGPDIYARYGFVFRNHDSFVHYRDRGWFKDQSRLAEREDRMEHRARDQEERKRSDEHEQYRDRDESSGGASRGATVYERSESGGAGRGEHIHENSSGGASGY